MNVWANALSRSKAVVEWVLLLDIARALFYLWGPLEIDLFASPCNAHLPAFFSINRWDLSALRLDVQQYPWQFQWMYAFLLLHLLQQSLDKLATRCAVMLLVTPWWPDVIWMG